MVIAKRVKDGERGMKGECQSNSEHCTSSQGDDPAFSSASDAELSYEHGEEEWEEF